MSTKVCFKCGAAKDLGEFYRHPQTADGYLNKCKSCTKLDARRNYDAHHERYLNYFRERAADPEVARRHKEGRRASNARYPERMSARHAVHNAVRDGRLQRKPCEWCGATDDVEAHHPDHTKPLEVVWLCVACHGRAHRKPRVYEP